MSRFRGRIDSFLMGRCLRYALWLILFNLVNEQPDVSFQLRGEEITVYARHDFAGDFDSWQATHGSRLASSEGTVDKALGVVCPSKWSGVRLPIAVEGSRGLKLALHMKATTGVESIGINVYDRLAQDNTTTLGPRFIQPGAWTPILYHLDQFRYNSSVARRVRPDAQYDGVQFVGPEKPAPGSAFSIDNVVLYRGTDTVAPSKVEGLTAADSTQGIQLSWRPASDNVAPMLYVVSRAEKDSQFVKIAETVLTHIVDPTAGAGSYRYRVLAVDFEENLGPWSDAVSVESAREAQEPNESWEQRDRVAYAARIRKVHARGRGRVRRGHGLLFGDSLTGATIYPRHCLSALGTLTLDNRGFAGQQTSFGRAKINEMLQQHNPEFVFVLFGTNNSKGTASNQSAIADLQAIVAACERRGSIAILGTIPPRGFRDRRSVPEAQFNQNVSALCRRLDVPTAYLFTHLQSAAPRRTLLDGVHWTSAGMKVAALAWSRTFQQVRFALRDRPDGEVNDPEQADQFAQSNDVRPTHPSDRPSAESATDPRRSADEPSEVVHRECPTCGFSPRRTRFAVTVSDIQSLEQAVQNARPDTTIWLRPGLYRLRRTLSLQTPGVVLRSEDGDPTKVFVVGNGLSDPAVGVALSIGASNITVDGISFGYVRFHGVQVRGENGVRNAILHNLHVFDTGQQLLKGSFNPKTAQRSHDCVVACSLFDYEKGAPGSYTNGVDVLGGRGWIVRDNVFRTIHGPLKSGGNAGPAILFWNNCHDTIVERNVITNCFRGIALGLVPAAPGRAQQNETYHDHVGGVIRNNIVWNLNSWADEGIEVNAARDVRIEYNTVYVTGRLPWSISARFPSTQALIRNNLSNGRIMLRDGSQAVQQGNVTGAQAAWFVDINQPDLRLNGRERQPVDAGVLIDDVPEDFDLRPRKVGRAPDVGALEFDPRESEK